jgi:hypothetical protein
MEQREHPILQSFRIIQTVIHHVKKRHGASLLCIADMIIMGQRIELQLIDLRILLKIISCVKAWMGIFSFQPAMVEIMGQRRLPALP